MAPYSNASVLRITCSLICVQCLEGVRSPSVGTQAENLCSTLCDRLMHVVGACHELVQSAVATGSILSY